MNLTVPLHCGFALRTLSVRKSYHAVMSLSYAVLHSRPPFGSIAVSAHGPLSTSPNCHHTCNVRHSLNPSQTYTCQTGHSVECKYLPQEGGQSLEGHPPAPTLHTVTGLEHLFCISLGTVPCMYHYNPLGAPCVLFLLQIHIYSGNSENECTVSPSLVTVTSAVPSASIVTLIKVFQV